MLVTRQSAPEHNHWSVSSKYETALHKSADSLRMSNSFEGPLSTQPDWQGHYSFLPPGDNGLFSASYEHGSSGDNIATPTQSRSTESQAVKASPTSPAVHHRHADPLGLRSPKQSSPIPEHPDRQSESFGRNSAVTGVAGSMIRSEDAAAPSGANSQAANSSGGQGREAGATGLEGPVNLKEEDEELLDDDDMMDGDVEGDMPSQPQTAAERTAQRRKMKRFRLTHQQTRFLMSEFAKQPHPDAAHRERLSREIPGLSPRQVQVWFQNRRAKIKRLTADDRDRMMKMRAVPDDFDNVQALHSPYGAVHGLGAPMASPVDFGTPSYAEHMMRPLMVDVRRGEGDEHISPTGLSPAFGGIGFSPSGQMSNSDILAPLSPASGDRYGYGSHLSSLSAGQRTTSNPFGRQSSLDSNAMQMSNHSRSHIRPLQPLQLRETMSRSRSDTLQSPLRSSMSWKGDSLDYTNYHAPPGTSPLSGRQPSLYTTDQMGSASASGLSGYDSSNYSSSAVASPSAINYPGFGSSSLQTNSQNRSRLRAASASLPLGLDLRTPFRSSASGQNVSGSTPSPDPRTGPASHLGGGSSYPSSFPSAPLTAPLDYGVPRTPGFRSSATDYSMPQMSAPIAPPNDFSQAFQASMPNSSTRTPMRDSFSGAGNDQRSDDYSSDPLGMKRKRSFTAGHSPVTGATSGSYTTST